MKDFKKYYQHFLNLHSEELHFTAHSHHFWPDVTREAQLQYWDDTARLVDDKWGHFFGEVMLKTSKHLAEILHLSSTNHLTFAPNTHELTLRVLSSFFENEKVEVVTTDSEFYSFSRQIKRLAEWPKFNVTELAAKNKNELISQLKSAKGDVLFLSQVFFNSGIFLDLGELREVIQQFPGIVILDGYHSFGAIPLNLSEFENKLYFTAGSYKYAQGGEGLCFLTSPQNSQLRPIDTGWFAEMGELAEEKNKALVAYPNGGLRFAGSTIDMTAFYRFNATWDLFKREGINVELIHQHVSALQAYFLEKIGQKSTLLSSATLLNSDPESRGHFLAYQYQTESQAKETEEKLRSKSVITDRRGAVLRIGIGLNHDQSDIEKLTKMIQ